MVEPAEGRPLVGRNGSNPASNQVVPVFAVPFAMVAEVALVSGTGCGAPTSTIMSALYPVTAIGVHVALVVVAPLTAKMPTLPPARLAFVRSILMTGLVLFVSATSLE